MRSERENPGRSRRAGLLASLLAGLLIFALPLWGRAEPGPDLEAVRCALERAGEAARRMEIPASAAEAEGRAAAEEAWRVFQSEAYRERIRAEQQRILENLLPGKAAGGSFYADAPAAAPPAGAGLLRPDERVWILVSSSVPRETLRNYVRDMDRLGEPNVRMILRGFVGGAKRIMPTLDFVRGLILRDPSCAGEDCPGFGAVIQVDPLVFSRFGVREVPAIVYARGVRAADPSMSDGAPENASVGEAFLLRGDVSLGYALETFRREAGEGRLGTMADRLR